MSLLKRIKTKFTLWLTKTWYQKKSILFLLLPLSYLYQYMVNKRYQHYKTQMRPGKKRAKVIIVGNITVGGSGKTPCVMAITQFLQANGYHPGIVSRGYGGHAPDYPYAVTPHTAVEISGDEALLLANELNVPVVVDPKRDRAVDYLLQENPEVDIVLSDDGLQHYLLSRDIEIVVVDLKNKFGNGFCLPVGPLREPIQRLQTVDLIIAQGEREPNYNYYLNLRFEKFLQVNNIHNTLPIDEFAGRTVHAIAAIANPERFFTLLEKLNIKVIRHPLPDHAWITSDDLNFQDQLPVLMTAKDAVKCKKIAGDNCWYLFTKPSLDENAQKEITRLLT